MVICSFYKITFINNYTLTLKNSQWKLEKNVPANITVLFSFSKPTALFIFKFSTSIKLPFQKERNCYVYSTTASKCTKAFITGMLWLPKCYESCLFSKTTLWNQSEGLWKSTLRKTLVFTKCKVFKITASAKIQTCKTEITTQNFTNLSS